MLVASMVAGSLLVGCGEVVAPPDHPRPPSRKEAVAEPAVATEPAASGPTALARIWTRQTPPFQLGIAVVGPHLVALSSGRLYVLDLHDGGARNEREACLTFEGAIGRMGERLALVCEQEIQLLSVPELALVDRVPLASPAVAAAFAPDHLALAFDDGTVRVLAAPAFEATLELAAGTIDAMAVAPDGARLAVAREGAVYLHDAAGPRLFTRTTLPAEALAFAPDGGRLFVGAPGGGIFDLEGDEQRLPATGNVRRALWPAPAWLVAVEAGGLLIVADGSVRSIPGDLGGAAVAGLAAAPDGRTLCLSDRDGRIACYADGEATAAITLEPASRDEIRMGGRVRESEGRDLTLAAEPAAPLPPEGTAVKVFRYDTSGGRTRWREVARGRVFVVAGRSVKVVLERPVESFWGVVEPIAHDAPVELAWEPQQKGAQRKETASPEGLPIPLPDEEDPPAAEDR